MKPIEVVYRHGRLYDVNTQQSVNLREGARIIIIVDSPDYVNGGDPYIAPTEIRTPEKVLEEVQKSGYYEYRKVFDRNQKLYFTITAGHRDTDRTQRVICQFEVTLLEELYLRRGQRRPE